MAKIKITYLNRVKGLIKKFSKSKNERIREGIELENLLNKSKKDVELKLKEGDIEGHTSAKGAVEFYIKKIEEFKNKEPLKIDTFELIDLAMKEKKEIYSEFDAKKEPLEKKLMELLEEISDLFEEHKKSINELNFIINNYGVSVGRPSLRMFKEIEVITEEPFIKIVRYPLHGGISNIMIDKR